MRNYDFRPLYRSSIGFDHLSSLLDAINHNDNSQPTYPPYNIVLVDKDKYEITMAVAGFEEDDIEILSEQQTLTVRGSQAEEQSRNYLHQGIAARNFERKFQLADHVEVSTAKLQNGLLHISLIREVPEEIRPRRIAINGSKAELVDLQTQSPQSEVA